MQFRGETTLKKSPQFCNPVSHLEFAEKIYGARFLLEVFLNFRIFCLCLSSEGCVPQLTLSPGVPGTPFCPGSPFAPLFPSSPGGPGAPGVPFSPCQQQKPSPSVNYKSPKNQTGFVWGMVRGSDFLGRSSGHILKSLTRSPFGPGSPFAPSLPGSP